MLISPGIALRAGNLLNRATEMQRACVAALRRPPRNRTAQRPIYFEDGGAIFVSFERATEALRKPVAQNLHEPARREVAKNDFGPRQLIIGANPNASENFSS